MFACVGVPANVHFCVHACEPACKHATDFHIHFTIRCTRAQVSKFIAWDYEDALALLERYHDTVMAVISGHDHDGAEHFDGKRNLAFVTLKGAVETNPGQSAHYVCQLSPTKMIIEGHGRSLHISPGQILIRQ